MPVQTIQEFLTFDYDSFFPAGSFFSLFSPPIVPTGAVVLYLLLSKPVCSFLVRALGITPKGQFIQSLTIVHSSTLAMYSLWTFLFAGQIVLQSISEEGLWPTVCGSYDNLWVSRGLEFWITHFYISKFYEFIDTWIILLKSREPSLLQTFHHAGIAVLMWGLTITAASPVLVVVVFNSFIHTLMYTYYVMAAFNIKSILKPYLTSMQVIQFLIGLSITLQTHFIPGCLNEAQGFIIWCMEIYTIVLIFLFGAFYIETYITKKGKKSLKDE